MPAHALSCLSPTPAPAVLPATAGWGPANSLAWFWPLGCFLGGYSRGATGGTQEAGGGERLPASATGGPGSGRGHGRTGVVGIQRPQGGRWQGKFSVSGGWKLLLFGDKALSGQRPQQQVSVEPMRGIRILCSPFSYRHCNPRQTASCVISRVSPIAREVLVSLADTSASLLFFTLLLLLIDN